MENKTITSLANPEIKFISSLKKNTNRKEHGKTIAEGLVDQVKTHPDVVKAYLGEGFKDENA